MTLTGKSAEANRTIGRKRPAGPRYAARTTANLVELQLAPTSWPKHRAPGGPDELAVSGIGETLQVTASKHPYQHPYGIEPSVPQRLMKRRSRQVGTIDAVSPRIRYAVPALHYHIW